MSWNASSPQRYFSLITEVCIFMGTQIFICNLWRMSYVNFPVLPLRRLRKTPCNAGQAVLLRQELSFWSFHEHFTSLEIQSVQLWIGWCTCCVPKTAIHLNEQPQTPDLDEELFSSKSPEVIPWLIKCSVKKGKPRVTVFIRENTFLLLRRLGLIFHSFANTLQKV